MEPIGCLLFIEMLHVVDHVIREVFVEHLDEVNFLDGSVFGFLSESMNQ